MKAFISPVPLSPGNQSRTKISHRALYICSHSHPNPHPLLTDQAAQRNFLKTTWGKSPKLFRNLLPFDNPLTPHHLAGLATETSNARIIRGSGNGPYTLELGPFTDETFQTIGDANWTLLVDHVNHHLPELSNLLDSFNFLPNWRVDDIMLSYAPPGGSVGPHVDNYDVFLLQGSGRRLWKTAYTPIPSADERIVDGLDVRVLEGGFAADEEWILEPGDALYIPPRFPHHGISLDDQCMTYSIGFRAPTVATLLSGWVEHLITKNSLNDRFYDDSVSDLMASIGNGARVSHAAAERALELVQEQLMGAKKEEFIKWFAQEVSNPKTFLDMEPLSSDLDPQATLDQLLDERYEHATVRQRDGSIFTFLEDSDGVSMYIDGEPWPVANVNIAMTICGKRCRPGREYSKLAWQHPSVPELLRKLLEADLLYIAESDG